MDSLPSYCVTTLLYLLSKIIIYVFIFEPDFLAMLVFSQWLVRVCAQVLWTLRLSLFFDRYLQKSVNIQRRRKLWPFTQRWKTLWEEDLLFALNNGRIWLGTKEKSKVNNDEKMCQIRSALIYSQDEKEPYKSRVWDKCWKMGGKQNSWGGMRN